MKRPRPLPAGPVTDFVAKTQRTTPTAQPNRVMFESRTMRTEVCMRAAISQWLCAIKSKLEATSSDLLPRSPLRQSVDAMTIGARQVNALSVLADLSDKRYAAQKPAILHFGCVV
jgi:hypothetical protein